MSSNKSTENKATDTLESKNITELQDLMDQIANLISDRQSKIRESAQAEIMRLSRESGLRVLVKVPKTKDNSHVGKTYQHPEDEKLKWTAKSSGAKPAWLRDLLKGGRSLEEFEVKE
jgi:DNA-binding protein H-NS